MNGRLLAQRLFRRVTAAHVWVYKVTGGRIGGNYRLGAGWRHRLPVQARVATTEQRERLWPRVVEVFADYERYQARTSRLIPVVIL